MVLKPLLYACLKIYIWTTLAWFCNLDARLDHFWPTNSQNHAYWIASKLVKKKLLKSSCLLLTCVCLSVCLIPVCTCTCHNRTFQTKHTNIHSVWSAVVHNATTWQQNITRTIKGNPIKHLCFFSPLFKSTLKSFYFANINRGVTVRTVLRTL